jgi:hypothetical protein
VLSDEMLVTEEMKEKQTYQKYCMKEEIFLPKQ